MHCNLPSGVIPTEIPRRRNLVNRRMMIPSTSSAPSAERGSPRFRPGTNLRMRQTVKLHRGSYVECYTFYDRHSNWDFVHLSLFQSLICRFIFCTRFFSLRSSSFSALFSLPLSKNSLEAAFFALLFFLPFFSGFLLLATSPWTLRDCKDWKLFHLRAFYKWVEISCNRNL